MYETARCIDTRVTCVWIISVVRRTSFLLDAAAAAALASRLSEHDHSDSASAHLHRVQRRPARVEACCELRPSRG